MSYQNRKSLSEANIGDYLRIGSRIYAVEKILKTQLVVRLVDQDTFALQYKAGFPKVNTKHVRKDTGTIVGSGGGYHKDWAHMFDSEEEIVDWVASKKRAQAEKVRKHEEAENLKNAKAKAIREANPNLVSTSKSIGDGMMVVNFVNKNGTTGKILYTITGDAEIYDWKAHSYTTGLKVQACAFCESWASSGEKSFHSRDNVEGNDLEEILLHVIGIYWS